VATRHDHPEHLVQDFVSEWRCFGCAKLLGLRSGASVLIRFARGHQYRAPRPVAAVCRRCGTMNET